MIFSITPIIHDYETSNWYRFSFNHLDYRGQWVGDAVTSNCVIYLTAHIVISSIEEIKIVLLSALCFDSIRLEND